MLPHGGVFREAGAFDVAADVLVRCVISLPVRETLLELT